MEIIDTSGKLESTQGTSQFEASNYIKVPCKVKIDIEKEEEKRFFRRLNRELKRIK